MNVWPFENCISKQISIVVDVSVLLLDYFNYRYRVRIMASVQTGSRYLEAIYIAGAGVFV